jgi:hypothetical protein
LDGVIRNSFVAQTSSGLEITRFLNERYGFCERRGAETERSFNDACLATDVAREIEDRRPPARRLRATPLPAQSLFDLRRVLLNPTVDCGVIHGHTALAHPLFEITVADSIAAIPTHRPKNDLAFEMAPLEL